MTYLIWKRFVISKYPDAITGIVCVNNHTFYCIQGSDLYRVTNFDRVEKVQSLTIKKGPVNVVSFRCLIWDGDDSLYTCDVSHRTIIKYSISNNTISVFAGISNYGYDTVDGNLLEAKFVEPSWLAIQSDGDIIVLEKRNIRKIKMQTHTVETLKFPSSQDTFLQYQRCVAMSGQEEYFSDGRRIQKHKDSAVTTVYDGLRECISLLFHQGDLFFIADAKSRLHEKMRSKWARLMPEHTPAVFKLNLHRTPIHPSVIVCSIDTHPCCLASFGDRIIVGCKGLSVLILEDSWKFIRYLWIGRLKEHSSYCMLAHLPTDIIKEIAQYLNV